MKISIGFLAFKLWKLRKEFEELKKENDKFLREVEVKRQIGFDSIWKIVNGRGK
jgi:hypothetical protein